MRDIEFTLEFTSHVLASTQDDGADTANFQRDSEGYLIFQQSWWHAAFVKAIAMERLSHIHPSDILMDLSVAAETGVYNRWYGKGQLRVHEAIMAGTQVAFSAVLYDNVSEEDFHRILDRVGRFIGLSPYGHNLGYGHFKVVSMEVVE